MRPSNYNYIKRIWIRNFPGFGIKRISNIIFFPFKLCLFVVLMIIITGLYTIFYLSLIILGIFWELIKLIIKSAYTIAINKQRSAKDESE